VGTAVGEQVPHFPGQLPTTIACGSSLQFIELALQMGGSRVT
jgi:hypothetical protein